MAGKLLTKYVVSGNKVELRKRKEKKLTGRRGNNYLPQPGKRYFVRRQGRDYDAYGENENHSFAGRSGI